MTRRPFAIFCLLLWTGITLSAQEVLDRPVPMNFPVPAGRPTPQQLIARGDSLHRTYHFQEAIGTYLSVSGAQLDSRTLASVEKKIAASQNGLNMTDFCASPHVVARQRFSRKDFFLFYPLKTQSWHAAPNPLDSLEGFRPGRHPQSFHH